MLVKTPVIGIPQYDWHKKACKYARKHPNFINIDISDFCYECHRHLELLRLFDSDSKNYTTTEYWRYYKGIKSKSAVIEKIRRYKQTYNSIKKYGYIPCGKNNCSIIVTDDGCRLDGSHRLSALLYLGIMQTKVNVLVYENVFSSKVSARIRKRNQRYRTEIYGLL